MLAILQGQPEPVTLAALVAACGLHPNTVREHLDALVGLGLVQRSQTEPKGRGRPAWLYEAVESADGPEPSEYAGLAATLASVIHRTSAEPRSDAIQAGTEWGRELARQLGQPPSHSRAAIRRQLVALLAEIGFAPETNDRQDVVKLTRCPLLEAAYRYPDIVCGVHLGIVRGAAEEFGGDAEGSEMHAFSEPGACRLNLVSRKPAGAR